MLRKLRFLIDILAVGTDSATLKPAGGDWVDDV